METRSLTAAGLSFISPNCFHLSCFNLRQLQVIDVFLVLFVKCFVCFEPAALCLNLPGFLCGFTSSHSPQTPTPGECKLAVGVRAVRPCQAAASSLCVF